MGGRVGERAEQPKALAMRSIDGQAAEGGAGSAQAEQQSFQRGTACARQTASQLVDPRHSPIARASVRRKRVPSQT